jgi:16S rRNA processing protein RimM
MKKAYLECGKIINTHGVIGAVKIDPWCDSPEVLASLKTVYFLKNGEYSPVKLIKASVFKRFVLATLEGINDIDEAARLKETVIYAAREDLPLEDGDYFIADLIGLPVIDADSGTVYGTLAGVINTGASDIYEIDTENGQKMMPAVEEFVKNVDTEKGIFVSVIPGMFD